MQKTILFCFFIKLKNHTMKIKPFFTISVLLSLTLFLFYIFKGDSKGEKRQNLIDYYGVTDDQLKRIEGVEKIEYNTVKNKSIENITVKDSENKEYLLNDLLNEVPKLIVKFSSLECSYCIEHIIKYVSKYEDEIGANNIIFLGYFINEKDFLMFNRLNNLSYKVFNIPNESIGLPVDHLKEPYVIVMDSSLIPKEVFVPIKSLPERTNQYFKRNKVLNVN